MSRKGAPYALKSKQIPRIFRSRRAGTCPVLRAGWSHVEIGAESGDTEDYASTRITHPSVSSNEDKREEEEEDEERKEGRRKARESEVVTVRYVGEKVKTGDVETVADIEKWLKTRTESVSSMDLDGIKSEVEEEGVDQYLRDELPHGFLGKDPDALSIDIDLSDKKLNLGYDPILQDLQSEKLLEACEKDEFILPGFQLDHLGPLSLSPDDMMVAGEILPSTSIQHSLTVSSEGIDRPTDESVQTAGAIVCVADSLANHATRVSVNDLNENLDAMTKTSDTQCKSGDVVPDNVANSYHDTLATKNIVENLSATVVRMSSEASIIEQLKSKAKIKLEPRIIKKRRKISGRLERKLDKHTNGGNFINSQDGIMAVVAISTDKISNMTQIVINTGTEEQVYQGKTSELIEATGNFPKLPKIETATGWNNTIEYNVDNIPINQHELIISNALEELGITDDNLQPISISENGKVWLCPREDCTRQFSRLYALKGHLLAHYGVRPFKCDFEGCTWAFYSEFKLKRHKETHLKRKDYICQKDGCNRRFTTVYNLWSHEKLHLRPKRIICHDPNCQEKFQTKRALEIHMKTHDQSHAPYICKHEGCGKRYYSTNALTSHQRCHSYKEIDVKCSWPGCGKVFDKPCRLKAHLRSHTGCKPYPCTFQGCQWAFSSSSKLKRHQKKHTNERKFICDVASCGKAFMRSEHLKEHRLTHKEGRYFQCYICDTKFSAKSSLYVHIKKHQNKEDVYADSYNSSNGQKRLRSKDTQCSRVNPVIKVKRKSMDVSPETPSEASTVGEPFQTDAIITCDDGLEQSLDDTALQQDQIGMLYHCLVETCRKSYTTKATLRAHTLKVHGTTVLDGSKSDRVSATTVANMDYILYTTPATSLESTEQMIMVAPCDAVILSSSPETDSILPEPEPPPINNLLKNSTSSHSIITQEQSIEHKLRKDQGSARTGLTFSDVWKLKTNGTVLDTVVGTSDVVLGTNDVSEGLLFTEELPSMYYQDDVVGTEYQVLLLDSGPAESTISLRGLE